MDVRHEGLAHRARGMIDLVTARVEHGAATLKREWCDATLAAIRETRASLDRWEPRVTSWGLQKETTAKQSDL
jgi:hypothetical protein